MVSGSLKKATIHFFLASLIIVAAGCSGEDSTGQEKDSGIKMVSQAGSIPSPAGDPSAAGPSIAQIQTALQTDPNNSGLHNVLGILYAQEGNIAGAHQSFMTAIEKNPENVEAYFNLGNLALQEQQVQMALQFYRQVLALDPEHQGALARLTQISKAMEQIREKEA